MSFILLQLSGSLIDLCSQQIINSLPDVENGTKLFCNKTDDLNKKLENVGKINAEKLLTEANIKTGLLQNAERVKEVADANLQVRKSLTV